MNTNPNTNTDQDKELPTDGDSPKHYPDGLNEAVIDELIEWADRQAGAACRPSSALVDGSALERRGRRMARRAVTTVRTLPVRPPVFAPGGEAA